MRKFTFTALATIMAASAGAAQAQTAVEEAIACDGCDVNPIEIHLQDELYLTGTGGLKLSNVSVVVPDVDVIIPVPLELDNAIELSQSNSGDISATKDLWVDGVDEMEASATAMANVANIDVEGGLALEGSQINSGDVMASLDITSRHGETVDVTSTAIGNAVNATTSGDAIFDMHQSNTGSAVTATLDANVMGGGVGEVNTAATAIANSFTLDMAGTAIGSIVQENCADVTAINNDTINVFRDPATATAIGNAINITRTVTQ